jgi:RNA polymerase sigma factor (sigma-70 family)
LAFNGRKTENFQEIQNSLKETFAMAVQGLRNRSEPEASGSNRTRLECQEIGVHSRPFMFDLNDRLLPMKPNDDSYPTRPSLLGRLKNTDDQQSWQQFNDIYAKLIFGFAIKAGLTEHEAQEVVQETLIAAARNLPEFRYDPKVCSFKTWLLNLSQWRVQDQLRKRQAPSAPNRTARRDGDSSGDLSRTATIDRMPDPAGAQLEELWDEEWKIALFNTAVEKVKAEIDLKQWQIFDLYVLKEWSARDAAKALGVSVGRVYLTKHRVGAILKKESRKLNAASS